MKSNTSRLSVGFVGFLEHGRPAVSALVGADTVQNVGFSESAPKPDKEPDKEPLNVAPNRARLVASDSRNPIIEPAIRSKIEAIEAQARAAGWPAELLWNANFWDLPRGLAAVLDPDDEIVEVAAEFITILRIKRDVLRFRRHVA
jgi:hypothetical protein